MDSKLLLIHCLSLLYLENELEDNVTSVQLCKDVITTIKLPDMPLELQSGREIQQALKNTVLWLMQEVTNRTVDTVQLMQRVRVSTKDDTYLYNALQDAVESTQDKDKIKKLINSYRKSLREYLNNQSVNSILTKAFQKVSFSGGTVNYKDFVREVYTQLEPYTHDIISSKHVAVVDSVDFDKTEELEELLNRSVIELSTDGVLRTGIQAINRMLGMAGGFRRGEFILLGALQHNFKTGMMLTLYKQLAFYNIPYMRDSAKKPMLLFISLENELTMNILWLYASIKENETGLPCDITTIDVEEAAAYIKEKMRINGYEIRMIRINPTLFTYMDFIDLINGIESEGYEIHTCFCDYLNMMNKKGLQGGPNGFEVRELFRIVRNFCAPRGITFITPHQLSSDAKYLIRQGVDNFVQEIANKGYYDSCKLIDQEVDLEIVFHIEMQRNKSFLTVQRGKHRGVKTTVIKDRFTVLPFFDVGAIKDDILGDDLSMPSVGGKSMAEGGQEWYDA